MSWSISTEYRRTRTSQISPLGGICRSHNDSDGISGKWRLPQSSDRSRDTREKHYHIRAWVIVIKCSLKHRWIRNRFDHNNKIVRGTYLAVVVPHVHQTHRSLKGYYSLYNIPHTQRSTQHWDISTEPVYNTHNHSSSLIELRTRTSEETTSPGGKES